jgi:hypothetical protein
LLITYHLLRAHRGDSTSAYAGRSRLRSAAAGGADIAEEA